jgi:hypothetical protein
MHALLAVTGIMVLAQLTTIVPEKWSPNLFLNVVISIFFIQNLFGGAGRIHLARH